MKRKELTRKVLESLLLTLLTTSLVGAQSQELGTGPKPEFEPFDVILMLDQGPVHARFGIALNARPVAEQRTEFIDELVRSLDKNGDGKLTRDEANQSNVLRRKLRKGTERFLRKMNLNSKQIMSTSEINTMVKKVAGQPVVFRQNNQASDSDSFIFELIDEDSSGVIDANEMRTAAARLIDRDVDEDDCIGFDEVQRPTQQTQNPMLVALGLAEEEEEVSHSVFSDLMRRSNERHLPARMVRKYDLNGNGKLSPKELRWEASRLKEIDVNQDGELSRSELAHISKTPLDIDLTVDVAPVDQAHPQLHIHHSTGRRIDKTNRPGMANIQLHNATLSIAYRHVDPIPEALDNARRRFNVLDADTNGYLDEPEIQGETLLQRGLFDQMDVDGDKKLFSEELEAYVQERAEVKSLSCRVSIYDTGSGFFQAMDHNNDGRISVRERRSVSESLGAMEADATPGVAQDEPARRFHLEFSRGSYLLFGPSEQLAKQTISFNTDVAVGPAWFTGSDRNNDGDLTWNEFLGHREDFHFLDVDGDELIDPTEALRAEQLRNKTTQTVSVKNN